MYMYMYYYVYILNVHAFFGTFPLSELSWRKCSNPSLVASVKTLVGDFLAEPPSEDLSTDCSMQAH